MFEFYAIPKEIDFGMASCDNGKIDNSVENFPISLGAQFGLHTLVCNFYEDTNSNDIAITPFQFDPALPSTLRSLRFERDFNQPLFEYRQLPTDHLYSTGPSLKKVIKFPPSLHVLEFGNGFERSLEHVSLPPRLQKLAFGLNYVGSLENVILPAKLQALYLPREVTEREEASFPEGLRVHHRLYNPAADGDAEN